MFWLNIIKAETLYVIMLIYILSIGKNWQIVKGNLSGAGRSFYKCCNVDNSVQILMQSNDIVNLKFQH